MEQNKESQDIILNWICLFIWGYLSLSQAAQLGYAGYEPALQSKTTLAFAACFTCFLMNLFIIVRYNREKTEVKETVHIYIDDDKCCEKCCCEEEE